MLTCRLVHQSLKFQRATRLRTFCEKNTFIVWVQLVTKWQQLTSHLAFEVMLCAIKVDVQRAYTTDFFVCYATYRLLRALVRATWRTSGATVAAARTTMMYSSFKKRGQWAYHTKYYTLVEFRCVQLFEHQLQWSRSYIKVKGQMAVGETLKPILVYESCYKYSKTHVL